MPVFQLEMLKNKINSDNLMRGKCSCGFLVGVGIAIGIACLVHDDTDSDTDADTDREISHNLNFQQNWTLPRADQEF